MSTDTLTLEYRLFVVDERPYCLWGTDIADQNSDFLDSLEPGYFEYVADLYFQALTEETPQRERESQYAALALRTTYSQALETLFALLGATVQAPWCVPAWLITYANQDLRNVVRKIDSGKPLPSVMQERSLSWSLLAEHVLSSLVMEDKPSETATKRGFGQLWARLASDFLDRDRADEYNGIKHGLRVRPGGFHIAIGAENQPGVRAPREQMQLLGKSEFGSRYLAIQPLERTRRHMRLTRHYRSWNPEGLTYGLHLLAMSIANILSALKILNGVPANQVSFQWPTDANVFAAPWRRTSAGIASADGPNVIFPEEFIEPFSKEDILSRYRQGHFGGFRRIVFTDQSDTGDDSRA